MSQAMILRKVSRQKIVRKKSPWVDVSFEFECLRGGKDLVGRDAKKLYMKLARHDLKRRRTTLGTE